LKWSSIVERTHPRMFMLPAVVGLVSCSLLPSHVSPPDIDVMVEL
jgi:hypothetical protein